MGAPYAVNLDPDAARHYAEKGATILLLDVPEQTHVAFDHQSFVVGPKFKGVKMLPPGPHMVSYNAASRTGDFAPTTSFFVHLGHSQVYVRKWDVGQEILLDEDPDEAEPFVEGVRKFEFDSGLAPYNLHAFHQWQALSQHISKDVISKLAPLPSGNISITAEADPASLKPVTPAEKKLYAQLQEGRTTAATSGGAAMQVDGEPQPGATASDRQSDAVMQVDEQPHSSAAASDRQSDVADLRSSDLKMQEGVGRCYYTQLPRLVKVAGMTPQQLTALNLDKTGLLEDVLRKHFSRNPDDLLGELQFSFLAFLMGQSLEGFAQWKAILHLLLGCEAAPLHSHVPFFIRFLRSLHSQLQHSLEQDQAGNAAEPKADMPFGVPMVEELLCDSFLQHLFTRFFAMLHEESASVDNQLKAVSKQLQSILQNRLGWNFAVEDLQQHGQDDDDDEYAPVVVQLEDVQL